MRRLCRRFSLGEAHSSRCASLCSLSPHDSRETGSKLEPYSRESNFENLPPLACIKTDNHHFEYTLREAAWTTPELPLPPSFPPEITSRVIPLALQAKYQAKPSPEEKIEEWFKFNPLAESGVSMKIPDDYFCARDN